MQVIADRINFEFTPQKIGIHFVGWRLCSESSESDVFIIRLRKAPMGGRSSIGLSVDYIDEAQKQGYAEITQKIPSVLIQRLDATPVTHEFGHLSGLRHEETNPASINDEVCLDSAGGLVWNRRQNWLKHLEKEKIYPSTQILTEYDPLSVMNVCHANNAQCKKEETQLSPLDQSALRSQYYGISGTIP